MSGTRRKPIGRLRACLLLSLWVLRSAPGTVAGEPSHSTDEGTLPAGGPGDANSYYYVPRLSGLHQFIGKLLQQGRIEVHVGGATLRVARYTAYSCDTVMALVGGNGNIDISWSSVTAVGTEGTGNNVAVFIRGGVEAKTSPGVTLPDSTVRLLVADRGVREDLESALADLMDACPPVRSRN